MTPPIVIILYQHLKLLSKNKVTNPLRKDERSTQQSVDKQKIYQHCKICLTILAVLHCKVTLQLHILLQRVRDIVVVGVVIVTLSANVIRVSACAVHTPQTAFLHTEHVAQVLLPLHLATWDFRRFVPRTYMSASWNTRLAADRMFTARSSAYGLLN